MTVLADKLTIGDYIGWADPKPNVGANDDYCIQCGRKLGKNAYRVHVSIAGAILPLDFPAEHPESQGAWGVGSECAKTFDPKVLHKVS